MYELGNIVQIQDQQFVVVNILKQSLMMFPCATKSESYELELKKPVEWTFGELVEANAAIIGTAGMRVLELGKRGLIFQEVEQFHHLFHRQPAFQPETSYIPYAGKVYDSTEMKSATDAVLDFWLTTGRYTKDFEHALRDFLGVRYVMVTNSGSSSNLLAISALTSPWLKSRRLVPGDEVITVAAGFPTTVAPIVQNGLIPVFLDVQLGTYNINVEELEQAISPKTKAIVLAHTMGNPFNLDAVQHIAQKYDLWLIEDNCDALGSIYRGKRTGSFGDIATSSFYPPHHITMGEGGAVYTRNPLLKRALESFRDWGRDCWCASGRDNTCGKRYRWQLGDLPIGYDHKYTYSHLGYNLKATDLQAAIGLAQFQKLPYFTDRRIHNFNRLHERLACLEDDLILPEPTPGSQPSWFGFILTVRDSSRVSRTQIVDYLEAHHIQTRMLFAGNIIRQPAFAGVEYRLASSLTNTEKIMEDTFLVGVYPGLTDEMIDYIADRVIEAVSAAKGQAAG